MKVLCTYTVNHKIDGKSSSSRVLIGLSSMEKEGNVYEYIKAYKMGKNCPDIAPGLSGEPLFDYHGKVAGFSPYK